VRGHEENMADVPRRLHGKTAPPAC
jgi:hypothetical protein